MDWVMGVDEVGRGALAGPVVTAVVCVPRGRKIFPKELGKLRDSKRLTKNQREKWFKYFKTDQFLKFNLGRVYPKTIDRINISKSANLAALRTWGRLCEKNNINPRRHKVFLDGGLYLGNGKNRITFAKTVVGGDIKIRAVAMASIVAKVARDGYMARLAKSYPQYGFEIHKGYGTKKHMARIKKYGPSKVHRSTFIS